MDLDKEDLINMICGAEITLIMHERLTKIKLQRFTGNQHNISYEWERSKLNDMSESELLNLYKDVKINKYKKTW